MNLKKFAIVATTMLLSGAFVVGTSVASNATGSTNSLPADNSLYVVDQNTGNVYEMKADGSQTLLNLQGIPDDYVPAGALNPKDNYAYLITAPSDTYLCTLHTLDLTGGTAPQAALPIMLGSEQLQACYGLNIDASGHALLEGYIGSDETHHIFSLNLKTGVATDVTTLEDELYGFTVAPDGTWYGLRNTGSLEQINKTTGAFTELVNKNFADTYDCKFDSSGTLWFTEQEDGAPAAQLYSWRVGDTDYTNQGDTAINGDSSTGVYGPVFVGWSTRTLKTQLASTGSDYSLAFYAAFGAIVLGAAMMFGLRRNQKFTA